MHITLTYSRLASITTPTRATCRAETPAPVTAPLYRSLFIAAAYHGPVYYCVIVMVSFSFNIIYFISIFDIYTDFILLPRFLADVGFVVTT
jgi:hypothetical protein